MMQDTLTIVAIAILVSLPGLLMTFRQLRNRKGGMQDEVAKLSSYNVALQQQVVDLSIKVRELEAKIAVLEADRMDTANLRRHNQTLQEHLTEAEVKIDDLRRALARCREGIKE